MVILSMTAAWWFSTKSEGQVVMVEEREGMEVKETVVEAVGVLISHLVEHRLKGCHIMLISPADPSPIVSVILR